MGPIEPMGPAGVMPMARATRFAADADKKARTRSGGLRALRRGLIVSALGAGGMIGLNKHFPPERNIRPNLATFQQTPTRDNYEWLMMRLTQEAGRHPLATEAYKIHHFNWFYTHYNDNRGFVPVWFRPIAPAEQGQVQKLMDTMAGATTQKTVVDAYQDYLNFITKRYPQKDIDIIRALDELDVYFDATPDLTRAKTGLMAIMALGFLMALSGGAVAATAERDSLLHRLLRKKPCTQPTVVQPDKPV